LADRPLPRTSHNVTEAPAGRSSRFSLPSAKNATERLSGDQITDAAPPVSAKGLGSASDRARTQTRCTPLASLATNAIWRPSGASASGTFSKLSKKVPPCGGGTEKRTTDAAVGGAADRDRTIAAAATAMAMAAIAHGSARDQRRRPGTGADKTAT